MSKEYEEAVRELMRSKENYGLEIGLYEDSELVAFYIRDDFNDLGEVKGVISRITVKGIYPSLKNLQLEFTSGKKSTVLSEAEDSDEASLLKKFYRQGHLLLIHLDEWGDIHKSIMLKNVFQHPLQDQSGLLFPLSTKVPPDQGLDDEDNDEIE